MSMEYRQEAYRDALAMERNSILARDDETLQKDRIAKHTPGPWTLDGPHGGWLTVREDPSDWGGAGYAAICRLPISKAGTWERSLEEANARVIAAAPELLKAAQAVVDRWDSPKWKDEAPTADYIAALRKAISKAIGA